MFFRINTAGIAHSAIVAPVIHTLVAKAASRTDRMIIKAAAAFRAVGFDLYCTADMHFTVFTPIIHTFFAQAAAAAYPVFIIGIAVAASLTC